MNNLHVLYLNCTSQAYWTSLSSSTARIPMQIYIIYVLEAIQIYVYTWNRIQNANFLTLPSEQYNTPSFQTRRVDDKTITKQSRSPERPPQSHSSRTLLVRLRIFTIFFCAILLSFPNWSKSAVSISISLRIQDFAGCVEECRNMARHVWTENMCVYVVLWCCLPLAFSFLFLIVIFYLFFLLFIFISLYFIFIYLVQFECFYFIFYFSEKLTILFKYT